MKKLYLLFVLNSLGFSLAAQHCPWDCSGLILLQTKASKSAISKLHPVLVDETKKEINDTIYGTEKETYDPCVFLSYNDFNAYRAKRIQVYDGYDKDTIYHFAKGRLIARYNYCNYRERKLYLRLVDPHARELTYHYVEIPDSLRIHLHDYNSELREGKKEPISKKIQPFIVKLSCDSLLLRKEECK
jgi:hypothetical protein